MLVSKWSNITGDSFLEKRQTCGRAGEGVMGVFDPREVDTT